MLASDLYIGALEEELKALEMLKDVEARRKSAESLRQSCYGYVQILKVYVLAFVLTRSNFEKDEALAALFEVRLWLKLL